jgi:hypothetical protein
LERPLACREAMLQSDAHRSGVMPAKLAALPRFPGFNVGTAFAGPNGCFRNPVDRWDGLTRRLAPSNFPAVSGENNHHEFEIDRRRRGDGSGFGGARGAGASVY